MNVSRKKLVIAKWLDKAKLSLLRKINQTSKVLFTRNKTTESLLQKQGEMLNSVRSKENLLKSLMTEKAKSKPLSKAFSQVVPEVTYANGTLSTESQAVGEAYKIMQV